MEKRQVSTTIDETQYELFCENARAIGTTPADALRMFIFAFNEHRGFPYDVKKSEPIVEPFDNEEEAANFVNDIAMEAINEPWCDD